MANTPVISVELLQYLQFHDTLLIQTLLTEKEVLLSKELNIELNDPDHPVSQNVIYFYSCIDMAMLLSNMKLENRILRSSYVKLEIDSNGENINGYYSGLQYIGLTNYLLYMIIFIDKDELFIGLST